MNFILSEGIIHIMNIFASRNHDSGVVGINIPGMETTFDWLDYH